jgi:predicted DNA binding CopG/RHH family protein
MKGKMPSDTELAAEAKNWDERTLTPAGWQDAPDAVPRAAESVAISIRLPRKMLAILKEFADRAGIGYQVLMKAWLDERIRKEARERKAVVSRTRPGRKRAVK